MASLKNKTLKCVGLILLITAGVIALVVEFGAQRTSPATREDNAYARMKSFACASDDKYDFLHLTWRNDTTALRHPGAFEGGGDKINLLFMPIADTLRLAGPSPTVTTSITQAGEFQTKISGENLPISRLSINVWQDGKEVVRDPSSDELAAIRGDVSQYLSRCLKGNISEIRINNELR